MQEVVTEHRTVVVVSHQMSVVRLTCDRGLTLGGGRVVFEGTAEDAASHYESSVEPPVHHQHVGVGRAETDVLRVVGPGGRRSLTRGEDVAWTRISSLDRHRNNSWCAEKRSTCSPHSSCLSGTGGGEPAPVLTCGWSRLGAAPQDADGSELLAVIRALGRRPRSAVLVVAGGSRWHR